MLEIQGRVDRGSKPDRQKEEIMLPIATPPASEVLVPSDLELTEIDELREWFCYVKPIGPSIKITVTAASAGHGFCVATAGTEVGPAEEIMCSHQAL